MNRTEAAMLLGVASSYDGRTVTDEDAIAWAAALPDIDFVEARDATVAHYRESSFRAMPADIIRRVYRKRAENRRVVGTAVAPPYALADNPRGQQAWLREYRSLAAGGMPHDEAVAAACDRLGVAPDTGEAVPPSRVRAAIEATSRRLKGTDDA